MNYTKENIQGIVFRLKYHDGDFNPKWLINKLITIKQIKQ